MTISLTAITRGKTSTMKVTVATVEQTVIQEDVLVEGPITLVALTATIQTTIVLIINTLYT